MKDFRLLGLRVRDVVTGFKGVVTTVSYDLYGCIQAVVTPPADSEKDNHGGRWFDTKRLVIESDAPVMAIPDFSDTPGAPEIGGPGEKPLRGGPSLY